MPLTRYCHAQVKLLDQLGRVVASGPGSDMIISAQLVPLAVAGPSASAAAPVSELRGVSVLPAQAGQAQFRDLLVIAGPGTRWTLNFSAASPEVRGC
jgi:hypothetical protein